MYAFCSEDGSDKIGVIGAASTNEVEIVTNSGRKAPPCHRNI